MSILSRFFYKRPPDGLLEVVERVYVFDSCFSTEVLPDELYQIYLHEIVNELHEAFPDSAFLAFNFREGEKQSQFAKILCDYDVTVIDYPRQYEGCPLLPLSLIQHFLRVFESWLSRGNQENIVLLHCERGGWPLLAFLLASFLIYRKLHNGERRTLEIVHREAPKGYLQLFSPLNPFPSQLRYIQYVARRNISPEWPPPERALSLDCVILRAIPSFDSENGCRPFIRIFGRNLLSKGGLSTQMLFSMPKKKTLRHYCQADSDVIKIDIQCLVQGDVVLECVHLDLDLEREVMMFRIMFNTAFIRSNILMLNSENLDILWDSKERYPKGFRVEVLFGEVDSISPQRDPTTILDSENSGLPTEAFSRVQELFSGVDWIDNNDDATWWLLKQLSRLQTKASSFTSPVDSDDEYNLSSTADSSDEAFDIFSKASEDPKQISHAIDSDFSPSESYGPHDMTLTSAYLDQPSTETVLLSPKKDESQSTLDLNFYPTPLPAPSLAHSNTCRGPPPPPPLPPPSPLLHSLLPSTNSLPPPLTPLAASLTQPPLPVTPLDAPPQLLPPPPQIAPPPPPPPPPQVLPKPLSTVPSPPPPPPLPLKHGAPPPPPPPPLKPPGTVHPPPPPPQQGLKSLGITSPPPPPPPPPPAPQPGLKSLRVAPPPPPPPPPPGPKSSGTSPPRPPPPPPPPGLKPSGPSPPPPPPPLGRKPPGVPPPPPVSKTPGAPPPPPPPSSAPPPLHKRSAAPGPPPPPGAKISNTPPPPPQSAGRVRASPGLTSQGRGRGSSVVTGAPKKTSLKPLHWVKVTRPVQGSLWADSQKQENQSRAPEIDISELETLFSAASVSDVGSSNRGGLRRGSNLNKPERVQLVDLRRANNCEIMLTKIKIPLPDMINAVLALDSSVLDIDQVENLIKFCPTKEEMDLLKNYSGDKDMLGKCEQFFLELMKVPRVESKLRVFAFRITFCGQVDDLRTNLNIINDATAEVKGSVKLRQIMQTILTLGNALNQGTARGSAIGFKLDSLLKLSDTRARNNKMTLMHYLCKLLAEKMPELLDFDKDLEHLEAASKIQLKSLAEEMQAVSKGLEKVEQELATSENDGVISAGFQKVLKTFLDTAEAEVRSLISLYSEVGRNADSLSKYFGEDPARCPFEQVTQILFVFVKLFKKARDENEKLAEAEKKRLEKEAMKEKATTNLPAKKEGIDNEKLKRISHPQK